MRIPNEIKAGTVVAIAIAIAVLFFFKTTKVDTATYQIKTSFGYAGDLKPNATVKLAGIEVGRVKEISFVYTDKTRVECLMELAGEAKVRTDAIAYIGTAGFVGDAFIGLTNGDAQDFVKNGGEVKSEDPMQMRELMKKADAIADNLNTISSEVKGIVTENRSGIDNIVTNVESATQNLEEFTQDLKKHPWKLMFKGE